jgi:hypothetical protein
MLLLRRFLAASSLFFWQGGFTFYAAVVVAVGTEVLGKIGQGFITRRVTDHLNLSGGIALALLAWELFTARDPRVARRWARLLLWLAMAGGLALLFVLHPRMDALLDPEDQSILNHRQFRLMHRVYLWVSTVQWGCALAYLLLTLRAWQAEDRCGTAEVHAGSGSEGEGV